VSGDFSIGGDGTAAPGPAILAAIFMIISGLWGCFMGLTAILSTGFFAAPPGYAFAVTATAWGAILLALGAAVFAAGLCVLLGQSWGRVAGVVLALLSAVANFAFLPYYPPWGWLVIAFDAVIIAALMASDWSTFA
jgi:uncharacterized YccA/Bax inhibitor family protein